MPKTTDSQHIITGDDSSDLAMFREQTFACELTFFDRECGAKNRDRDNAGLSKRFACPAEAAVTVIAGGDILRAADMRDIAVSTFCQMVNRQFHRFRIIDSDARDELAFGISENRDHRNVGLDARRYPWVVPLERGDD